MSKNVYSRKRSKIKYKKIKSNDLGQLSQDYFLRTFNSLLELVPQGPNIFSLYYTEHKSDPLQLWVLLKDQEGKLSRNLTSFKEIFLQINQIGFKLIRLRYLYLLHRDLNMIKSSMQFKDNDVRNKMESCPPG